jgi:hypothetical protein
MAPSPFTVICIKAGVSTVFGGIVAVLTYTLTRDLTTHVAKLSPIYVRGVSRFASGVGFAWAARTIYGKTIVT